MIRDLKLGFKLELEVELDVEQKCKLHVVVLASISYSHYYHRQILHVSSSGPESSPVRPALQCLFGPLPPWSIGLCTSLIPIHDTDKHKTDESNNDIVGFKGYQLLDSAYKYRRATYHRRIEPMSQ
jgi:hypothetical protein